MIERHITRKVIIVDPVVSTPVYSSSGGQFERQLRRQLERRPDLGQPGAGARTRPPATSTGGS